MEKNRRFLVFTRTLNGMGFGRKIVEVGINEDNKFEVSKSIKERIGSNRVPISAVRLKKDEE